MTLAKHTLTVFSQLPGVFIPPFPPQPGGWNRTVIKYGQWENATDRNVTGEGATFIDKHIGIIIPKAADAMGKGFLNEIDWNRLPVAERREKWTLRIGDIVVFGEAPEISGPVTIDTVRADFRHCLVKSVEDLTKQPVLPHWAIVGI